MNKTERIFILKLLCAIAFLQLFPKAPDNYIKTIQFLVSDVTHYIEVISSEIEK